MRLLSLILISAISLTAEPFKLEDNYQSAIQAARTLSKEVKGVTEKAYAKLGKTFEIVKQSTKTKDAHIVWRFLGALMMTGEKEFIELHDRLVKSGYHRNTDGSYDNTLLSQIGFKWASDKVMNEADLRFLNSRFGLHQATVGESQLGAQPTFTTSEMLSTWSASQTAQTLYAPIEGITGTGLYWSHVFMDDEYKKGSLPGQLALAQAFNYAIQELEEYFDSKKREEEEIIRQDLVGMRNLANEIQTALVKNNELENEDLRDQLAKFTKKYYPDYATPKEGLSGIVTPKKRIDVCIWRLEDLTNKRLKYFEYLKEERNKYLVELRDEVKSAIGQVAAAQEKFESAFSLFNEPATHSVKLGELIELGRSISELEQAKNKANPLTEEYKKWADEAKNKHNKLKEGLTESIFNGSWDAARIYIAYLVGGQKKGKTVIAKALKYMFDSVTLGLETSHLQALGLAENFENEALKTDIRALCGEHLDHTVTMNFVRAHQDTPTYNSNTGGNTQRYNIFLDAIGLGSSALQDIGGVGEETFDSTNQLLAKLLKEARDLEAFQTEYQKLTNGTPIFVIEQWDDAAQAMVGGKENCIIIHNLRFAKPEEITTYIESLKSVAPAYHNDRSYYYSHKKPQVHHYILGPLNTDDSQTFKVNLGVLKSLRAEISSSVDRTKKQDNISITAPKGAYEAVYGEQTQGDKLITRNALSEYPMATSRTDDGRTQHTLALHDCKETPTIHFQKNYMGDLEGIVSYNNFKGSRSNTSFTVPLTSAMKNHSDAFVKIVNTKGSGYVTTTHDSISITLPDESIFGKREESNTSRFLILQDLAGSTSQTAKPMGTMKLKVPVKTQDIATAGIPVEVESNNNNSLKLDDPRYVRTIAVEGNYNDGKTTIIRQLLGIDSAGVEGSMVHTEGVTSFVADVNGELIEVRDTMGRNSGTMQSEFGGKGATDEDVRRQQHAIAAAVEPANTDITLLVTKAFDNVNIKQLLEGGYDPSRTVVIHNMKDFRTNGIAYTYMGRVRNFIEQMGNSVLSETNYDITEKGDWFVIRQPNGMVHVFMKNFGLDGSTEFNNRTIDFLHSIILNTEPRAQRTLAESRNHMVASMARKAFILSPDDKVTTDSTGGTHIKPVFTDESGHAIQNPPLFTTRQDSYGKAVETKPLDRSYTGTQWMNPDMSENEKENAEPDDIKALGTYTFGAPFIGLAAADTVKCGFASEVAGDDGKFPFELKYSVPTANITNLANLAYKNMKVDTISNPGKIKITITYDGVFNQGEAGHVAYSQDKDGYFSLPTEKSAHTFTLNPSKEGSSNSGGTANADSGAASA